ncbi:MAG TPA: hypothetical protein VKY74_11855 [Chloroflexia bacterium]|nr:hypothetical protein [Chloroflexia bacterium]
MTTSSPGKRRVVGILLPRMRPLPVAYGLIGCFVVIERLLRQGPQATSLHARREDRGSTRSVGAAFGVAVVALVLAPFLNRVRVGRLLSEQIGWSGIVAMLAGLALRIWASRVLGVYYTRTLRVNGK